MQIRVGETYIYYMSTVFKTTPIVVDSIDHNGRVRFSHINDEHYFFLSKELFMLEYKPISSLEIELL